MESQFPAHDCLHPFTHFLGMPCAESVTDSMRALSQGCTPRAAFTDTPLYPSQSEGCRQIGLVTKLSLLAPRVPPEPERLRGDSYKTPQAHTPHRFGVTPASRRCPITLHTDNPITVLINSKISNGCLISHAGAEQFH